MMLLLAQSVNSAPIGVIAPVTIYDPGEYQLLTDDLGEAGTAIEIAASNVVFDGNGHTISGIGTNSGVFAKQHTNIQVKNLNINNFTNGIYYGYLDNSKIENCHISDTKGAAIGLQVSNNHDISILSNVIQGNQNNGIYSNYYLDNMTIADNTITNNKGYGITLIGGTNNLISDNIITNNGYGLQTGQKSGQIFGNTITGNLNYGLHAGSGTLIYNNLFNNVKNLDTPGGANTWNIAKTLGTNIIGGPYLAGNYYAQPNGQGFSQVSPGDSDGICTAALTISSGNIDLLPLHEYTPPPTTTVPTTTVTPTSTSTLTPTPTTTSTVTPTVTITQTPTPTVIPTTTVTTTTTSTPTTTVTVTPTTTVTPTVTQTTTTVIPTTTVTTTTSTPTTTITMTPTITVTPTATTTISPNNFLITAMAGPGGSITPYGPVTVPQGSNRVFNITPYSGYKITDVVIDGSSVGAIDSYTFNNVQANHSINANFGAFTYTLNLTAGTGGSVSPSGLVSVNPHDNKTVTITPLSCYDIKDVVIDGKSNDPITNFTFNDITTDHVLIATFVQKQYTISASTNGYGGSIIPSGDTKVNCGDNKEYSITADYGYSINDVAVDSVSQGKINKYTFSNIIADHKIFSKFSLIQTGSLFVTSVPVGVQVFIDGVRRDISGTPVTLTGIPIGDHTLVVKAPFYQDKSVPIRIDEGKNTEINVIL